MATIFKNNKYPDPGGSADKTILYVVGIILFFLLLCWGIWWFFDYKAKELKQEIMPQAARYDNNAEHKRAMIESKNTKKHYLFVENHQ